MFDVHQDSELAEVLSVSYKSSSWTYPTVSSRIGDIFRARKSPSQLSKPELTAVKFLARRFKHSRAHDEDEWHFHENADVGNTRLDDVRQALQALALCSHASLCRKHPVSFMHLAVSSNSTPSL